VVKFTLTPLQNRFPELYLRLSAFICGHFFA